MFIVLLGCFKAKPVVLNLGFHQIKHDLKHVHQTVLSGSGFRPFNLSQKENERTYKRIFELCEYQRWSSKAHGSALEAHLTQQAKAWSAPRHLFDTTIEYLSGQKIAIPAYSTLQKIISQVVGQEQDRLIIHADLELSQELKHALAALVSGD